MNTPPSRGGYFMDPTAQIQAVTLNPRLGLAEFLPRQEQDRSEDQPASQ
jgi:hypothetical protein